MIDERNVEKQGEERKEERIMRKREKE